MRSSGENDKQYTSLGSSQIAVLLTRLFGTTPHLILLLLFANDFVTTSLADYRVTFSRKPDRWRIWPLTASAMVIAIARLRV